MIDSELPQQLTPQEAERLNTLRQVVKIDINGDWDEPMINAAFDELERVFRVDDRGKEESEEAAKPNSPSGRRRGRR